ncbi:MAG: c-type cytochrome biogenesis protein CcmI [Ralstonia sp.]|jgi:cytochrome c-type biogenesis protein CcmH|uniref:Cytochrome c-type biogenesis protein H TPR domain-containing protein n=3 Tax=Pseudomonadota TaxID=1224 RepID=A0ABM9IJ22_RALPI|nr:MULTISPECIES: c-type cytochrome biogenesis protein CcmI [Ralstonia]MBA4015332.1 c-type cytochrome biogenesis protein CcmI [Ralstonia sp.]MBA4201781.1 c-type cytochrome biogenesis protein CcmI [Ralstonia sp.]MBA4229696.1 c-type cytochrome biogenesis protein CcmI [Ralstonia sp.]MBA4236358.1 c-type cytochrome biogenesis protein CcmI [Ralstonia sp.]MBA4280526.1 c-type cytochrome biogenesis protein CcmI [Ralstonia sp.]
MTVMTLFWLLAAALTAITMAVLLTPLLRRARTDKVDTLIQRPTARSQMVRWYQDQLRELDADLRTGAIDAAGHAHARAELGRRLLDDTADTASTPQARPDRRPVLLAAVLLAALPTSAVLLYQHLGKPASLWMPGDMTTAARSDHTGGDAQIESMVNSLAQRLRDTPDDAPGWALLARSYSTMERPADAVAAYAKAVALAPEVASLRADYADALATAQGGTLAGAPIEQVRLALKADPDEPKALALAASAAVERGDVSDAIAHWERLYQLLPPESAGARQIATNLAAARADQQKAPRVK